jgi:sigma-B regulation protein RsbU (phosphoserine phosphatase)
MFTDGVSEALDATDVEFGEARILDSLTRRRATSPDDLLQGLFADVDAFVGAAAQADDMTCVALAWRGSAHA